MLLKGIISDQNNSKTDDKHDSKKYDVTGGMSMLVNLTSLINSPEHWIRTRSQFIADKI